jgi:hypothetical protein
MNTELMEKEVDETATVKESSTLELTETIKSETRNRPSYKTMYEEKEIEIQQVKKICENQAKEIFELNKRLDEYRYAKTTAELPANFNSIEMAIIKFVSFDKFFCNIEVNETGIKVFSVTKA